MHVFWTPLPQIFGRRQAILSRKLLVRPTTRRVFPRLAMVRVVGQTIQQMNDVHYRPCMNDVHYRPCMSSDVFHVHKCCGACTACGLGRLKNQIAVEMEVPLAIWHIYMLNNCVGDWRSSQIYPHFSYHYRFFDSQKLLFLHRCLRSSITYAPAFFAYGVCTFALLLLALCWPQQCRD